MATRQKNMTLTYINSRQFNSFAKPSRTLKRTLWLVEKECSISVEAHFTPLEVYRGGPLNVQPKIFPIFKSGNIVIFKMKQGGLRNQRKMTF